MQQNLLRFIVLAIVFSIAFSLQAQTIQVVPEPGPQYDYASRGNTSYFGYSGSTFTLNNALYGQFQTVSSSLESSGSGPFQFCKYVNGSLPLISNPDNGLGVYPNGPTVVFNNTLFFIYINASGSQQLGTFDGTSITIYPNPDASGAGYIGSPRILNNTFYGAYKNASDVVQLATFNGSRLVLIPNPDNSSVGFDQNYSVIFNNKICGSYTNAAKVNQLATYDGKAWTLLPNPDNTTAVNGFLPGFQPTFPIAYDNKIYIQYFSTVSNQNQLMEYDGANNPTLISNPQNSSTNQGGYVGLPIINNDTLFFQYYNTANVLQVAKFGGTSISLVPNPDNTTYGFWNTPIIYNNNLYIFYLTPDGIHHLAQYQTASNSLKVYSNPDGGLGYWDKPIVYDNNLLFQYYNAGKAFQVGYFDGASLHLITGPNGNWNNSQGEGYTGSPLVFNNLLYFQYTGVTYNSYANLAYIDGSALPVTLLNFTAQAQGKSTLLQWKTANETNNAFFDVERSADGALFTGIGKINGHGSSAIEQQYNFADNSPLQGDNYYRLKQVDLTGKATYSAIAKVSFDGAESVLRVYPNPAKNSVVITLPLSAAGSVVTVFDMNGRQLMQKQIGANAASQTLEVSGLAAGKYQLQWLSKTGKLQTIGFVKQ